MGCLFGAGLSLKNKVVMLCRREKQVEDINTFGLAVYEPDGTHRIYKERVVASLSGQWTTPVDWVVVITKTLSTREALEQNKHLFAANTKVLCLQNGAGNDELLAQYCPKENTFIGTTTHNCSHLGNGIIRHAGSGITCIGACSKECSAREAVDLFEQAGFKAQEVADIQRLIWEKLFISVSGNAFTAIARAPFGSCVASDNAWFFMERMICETVDVARASGYSFSSREILDMVHSACANVATGFSSMSQDVINGRPTEIDCINGYVVRQAKKYNVPAPYNEFVLHLVHAIEDTYTTRSMPTVRYSGGQVVLQEGKENSTIFRILKGSVNVYRHYKQPDETFIVKMKEGSGFGEFGALLGKRAILTFVCAEEKGAGRCLLRPGWNAR